ncbi:MAG: fasciclin domain-containing protein [Trueperaceae bacterium]
MKRTLNVLLLSLILALGLAIANEHEAGEPPDQPATEQTEQPAAPEGEATDADEPEGEAADTEAPEGQADSQAEQGLFATLSANPDFSTFADALQRTGMADRLEQQGAFTILAPTNQAFEQAGIELDSLDDQQLIMLVSNHIISGLVAADELSALGNVRTMLGGEYAISPSTDQPVAGGEAAGETEVAGGGEADANDGEADANDEADPGDEVAPGEPDDFDMPAQPGDGPEPGTADPVGEDTAESEEEADADQTASVGGDSAEGLSIGDAMVSSVTEAGTGTSAGIIYGIDSVLLPASFETQGVEGGGAADTPATPEDAPATPEDTPATPESDDDEADPGDEQAPGEPDDFDMPARPGDDPEPGTADPVDEDTTEPEGSDEPGANDDADDSGSSNPGDEAAPGVADDEDSPAQPGGDGDEN